MAPHVQGDAEAIARLSARLREGARLVRSASGAARAAASAFTNDLVWSDAAGRAAAHQLSDVAGQLERGASRLESVVERVAATARSYAAMSGPGEAVSRRSAPGGDVRHVRHGTTGPVMTAPEPGRMVIRPASGETPLIGLPAEFYDPTATAQALLPRLGAEGVPRLPMLSPSERGAESGFADWVQANPERALIRAILLVVEGSDTEKPVLEVDLMKRLVPRYGRGREPADDAERRFRLENNHALHPTAVAIARLALVARLDALQALPVGDPLKQVFVTNGGCAAGKGNLSRAAGDALVGNEGQFGATWDAAGEGDGLENAWILRAARARGLRVIFGYAEADPITRYQGVLARAGTSGRVVDVITFANSYVDGATEMKRFLASAEYRRAYAQGAATAFGMAPGAFNAASVTDKTQKAYPDWTLLSPSGPLESRHVGAPPDKLAVIQASLRILEEYCASERAAGRDPTLVAHGALGNALKFLPDQPPEIRSTVLDAHARILGDNP